MKKRFLSLLLCVCMVCALVPFTAVNVTAAGDTDTITVTSAADSGNGTLRAAIEKAAATTGTAYTITFAGAVTKITLASTLTIAADTFGANNPLTIDGAGKVTIDGGRTATGGGVTIMGVNSGNAVTLKGLTLQNGYALGCGAVANNGTLTVTGCTFTDNSAENHSGAVWNYGTLTAKDCAFTGNEAGTGGAIINNGTLTAEGCTFTGNEAGYDGGAIYNNGGGTLTLANCTLAGNEAGTGGAIYNNGGGTLTLANCTLAGNEAGYDGGAIENRPGGIAYLLNSILVGNTASNNYGLPLGGGDDIYTAAYNFANLPKTYAYYCLVGKIYQDNDDGETPEGGTPPAPTVDLTAFSGTPAGTSIDVKVTEVFATVDTTDTTPAAVAYTDGLYSIKAGGAADGKGVFVWHNADWTALAYSKTRTGDKTAVFGDVKDATIMLEKDQRGAAIGDSADIGAVTVSTAAGGSAMQLVDSTSNPTGGISGYTASGYHYVYYGVNGSTPIKWRVLDDQTNTGGTGLFLLSEDLLGMVCFDNTSPYSNEWQRRDAQGWCKDFAGESGASENVSDAFTPDELAAILATTKSDGAFTSSTYSAPFAASHNILNGDKVFFLSAAEAENSDYGFANDSSRIAKYTGSACVWWLRSPYAYHPEDAGAVSHNGSVSFNYVGDDWAARPAFNLNLNSVLFTSAAVGGKSASGMGTALTAVGENSTTDWKLTLLDNAESSGRENFDVTTTEVSAAAGGSVSVTYSGAKQGTTSAPEYLSAMIADSSGNVLYYGRLKTISAEADKSGTQSITIPSGLTAGSYTLKVFNEQYNGDYKTDYASAFEDVTLTVTGGSPAPALTAGDVNRTSDTAATVKFTSNEAGTYYYSVVESGETAPTIDTEGTGTACDTKEQTITLSNLTTGAKDIYIVVKDAAGNESDALKIAIPGIATFIGESKEVVHTGQEIEITGITTSGLPIGYTYKDLTYSAKGTAAKEYEGAFNGTVIIRDVAGNDVTNNYLVTTTPGKLTITHSWATNWSSNNTHHWHDCTAEGCDITDNSSKNGYGTHVYDNDTDTTCNTCGYERTITDPTTPSITADPTSLNGGGTVTLTTSAEATSVACSDTSITVGGSGTSFTATLPNVTASYTFTATFADNVTATCTVSVTASTAPTPTITFTTQPAATTTVTAGSISSSLTAAATVTPSGTATLNWYACDASGNISGTFLATGGSFAIPTTLTTGTYYYVCEATYTGAAAVKSSVATVTVNPAAVTAYAVTVNGSYAGTSGAGDYALGATVTIYAGTRSNYTFAGWTVNSGGVTLNSPSSATTTFSMPGNAVTVTANWTYNGGGGGYIPPIYYTLHFDTNGGSAIESIRRVYGTTLDLSGYTPTREGYEFTGWYADEELTEKISSVRMTGSKTVYAGWSEIIPVTPEPVVNPFTDVKESDWFYDEVMYVYENELMTGISDTLFDPYGTTTRAMIATVLWRMEGSPAPTGGNPFTDVEDGQWYTYAITWAAENDIAEGYGSGLFGTNDPVTREQLAAFLYRYAQYKGYDLSADAGLAFADAGEASDWAFDALCWCTTKGIINGKDNNMLDPKGNATRAEFAAMLQRFIGE